MYCKKRKMMQFSFRGDIPRRVASDKVHLVTSRTTIFGVHKPQRIDAEEASISKTALIAFLEKKDAEIFMKKMKKQQEHKAPIDRCIVGRDMIFPYPPCMSGGSLMPLRLESSFTVNEMQILCNIHYFDMYLAFSMVDVNGYIDLACYTQETSDLPNRSTINHYMEDMYRKRTNR